MINFLGGNDNVTVNSGTYASFGFPSGNKVLAFGLGGGNPIVGPVNFGAGNDRMEVHSGTVGAVDQADGADTFIMTAGTVASLQQGGGLDTFTMSGGVITGAFTEGDFVTITGGSIGSVNLTIANNIFTMSGGMIVGDVVAGFQNDTVNFSGGRIGGNLNLGNGDNTINITGGQIAGTVSTGTDTDRLTWDGGGTIGGAISLGSGNDTAMLRGLTSVNLTMALLDGGLGTDQLTFDNVVTAGIARFQNWEAVNIINASQLTFDGNLTLGDTGTKTGTLSIDATSTVFAGNGVHSIVPFTVGQLVTVTNAGTIDLTNGPPATDSLTIIGNYIGAGGRLLLNTVVAGDGAPSDKLVISGGNGSGSTSILVSNAGGAGALTTANGILLVEAVNGATTTATAFSLARPVSAGPYDYFLFKGGVTPGSEESWFLRSSLVPGPTPAPGTLPLPPPVPGAPPIPLFRPEVVVQSAVPSTALTLALVAVGTFNERQGDQLLLRSDRAPGVWGRVFGQQTREHFAQGAQPEFYGTYAGFQAGRDFLQLTPAAGHTDHAGLYIAYSRAVGDVNGFVDGVEGTSAGHLDLAANSVGGYWTHIGPSNWYIDAVLQGSFIDGTPISDRQLKTNTYARAITASLEGGYPIPLAPWFALEPQAQVIWQRLWINNAFDGISPIAFSHPEALTGRVGTVLRGTFGGPAAVWQPYLKGNVWFGGSGTDLVTFTTTPVPVQRNQGTALEGGGGITGKLTQSISVYADASYLNSVSGEQWITLKGNVGLRVT